ncbi:hypothetical protein [Halosimplex carlsbadense]|uniref:hypothetical protein n=1 Tax=Halosimplex carlsbadense TaxID=171164 RepID=UPI001268C19B|nr:hypothetical protein [Halosimplex carlsbadense]
MPVINKAGVMTRPWSRRAVLCSTGTGIVLLSGCASFGSEQSTNSPIAPVSVEEIASVKCPPSGDDDATVCSQTVEADAASVYLLPTPTVGETPDSLELTFTNASGADLTFNPYSWSVWRKSASGWSEIEQESSGGGELTVAAGNSETWTVETVVGYIDESAALHSGAYAAGINVPNPDGDDWITCLAVFGLR